MFVLILLTAERQTGTIRLDPANTEFSEERLYAVTQISCCAAFCWGKKVQTRQLVRGSILLAGPHLPPAGLKPSKFWCAHFQLI